MKAQLADVIPTNTGEFIMTIMFENGDAYTEKFASKIIADIKLKSFKKTNNIEVI